MAGTKRYDCSAAAHLLGARRVNFWTPNKLWSAQEVQDEMKKTWVATGASLFRSEIEAVKELEAKLQELLEVKNVSPMYDTIALGCRKVMEDICKALCEAYGIDLGNRAMLYQLEQALADERFDALKYVTIVRHATNPLCHASDDTTARDNLVAVGLICTREVLRLHELQQYGGTLAYRTQKAIAEQNQRFRAEQLQAVKAAQRAKEHQAVAKDAVQSKEAELRGVHLQLWEVHSKLRKVEGDYAQLQREPVLQQQRAAVLDKERQLLQERQRVLQQEQRRLQAQQNAAEAERLKVQAKADAARADEAAAKRKAAEAANAQAVAERERQRAAANAAAKARAGEERRAAVAREAEKRAAAAAAARLAEANHAQVKRALAERAALKMKRWEQELERQALELQSGGLFAVLGTRFKLVVGVCAVAYLLLAVASMHSTRYYEGSKRSGLLAVLLVWGFLWSFVCIGFGSKKFFERSQPIQSSPCGDVEANLGRQGGAQLGIAAALDLHWWPDDVWGRWQKFVLGLLSVIATSPVLSSILIFFLYAWDALWGTRINCRCPPLLPGLCTMRLAVMSGYFGSVLLGFPAMVIGACVLSSMEHQCDGGGRGGNEGRQCNHSEAVAARFSVAASVIALASTGIMVCMHAGSKTRVFDFWASPPTPPQLGVRV